MTEPTQAPPVSTPDKPPELPSWTARVTPHVELANKSMQILAIIVAGIWAGWTWLQTIAPGLGTGVLVSAEVKAPWDPLFNACAAEVFVSVENVGTRNVTVARTKYEIKKAPRPMLGPSDNFKLVKNPPSDAKTLASGELNPSKTLAHVYPPKGKSSQSLDFLISPDETEEIWFSVELLDGTGNALGDQYGAIEPCKRPTADNPTK
jgi:hypothetical protein